MYIQGMSAKTCCKWKFKLSVTISIISAASHIDIHPFDFTRLKRDAAFELLKDIKYDLDSNADFKGTYSNGNVNILKLDFKFKLEVT